MSLIVFSKPIHSGKTTELQNWSAGKKNMGGILMPDIGGCRKMLDLRSRDVFDAECMNPGETALPLQSIGKFHFYEAAFAKANAILLHERRIRPDWLVLDEAGRLEMELKGFYPAMKMLLPHYLDRNADAGNLLLVIRESLLEELFRFFDLGQVPVIHELSSLF